MRKTISRLTGYGPTSCSLIAFLAELFQLFTRKRNSPPNGSSIVQKENIIMKTTTETQALVRPEPNRPTHIADASQSRVPETSNRDDISKLAYGLWEQRGSSQGSADEDWLEAERDFRESPEHLSR
jgi:Protein of unknown function (DUF2934)